MNAPRLRASAGARRGRIGHNPDEREIIVPTAPYLESPLREAFDAWLEGTVSRFVPPLTFTELRKGAQALSTLYVERRGGGALATRAIEGTGKRAALATYFAALHFLVAHHAVRAAEGHPALVAARRVVDLGCGTGAVGAAVAASLPAARQVVGVDRSGWALEEAERTWRAFGLEGRAQRGELPNAAPRGGRGTLYVAGWSASELDDAGRSALLRRLVGAVRRGAAIFVVEPLAKGVAPWWPEWEQAFAPLGVRTLLVRVSIDRPHFIREMDKAAHLDHQVIGARVLAGGRLPAAAPVPDDDRVSDADGDL